MSFKIFHPNGSTFDLPAIRMESDGGGVRAYDAEGSVIAKLPYETTWIPSATVVTEAPANAGNEPDPETTEPEVEPEGDTVPEPEATE